MYFKLFMVLLICHLVPAQNISQKVKTAKRHHEKNENCMMQAKGCTERRLKNLAVMMEVPPEFQDGLYHYCLDLFDCQEGKELICNKIGNEAEYPDPTTMLPILIQQCNAWEIPTQQAHQGDLTAHYVYFHNKINGTSSSRT